MTMDDIRLIGDELYFERVLIALVVTQGVPATVRARFEELLADAEYNEPPPTPDPESLLNKLLKKATENAKGGLLRIDDLANIIARMEKDQA